MESTEPKVTVIIPNWNGMDHIVECLKALLKADYSNFNVIVVDNNSEDNSPEAIAEAFPQVEIIRNTENLGFAEGCNIGMRRALEGGSAYVWLLNNDAFVEKDTLQSLVRIAEQENRIGMVGSKVCYYDAPDTIWGVGMKISWIRGETYPIGWRQQDVGQFRNWRDVEGLAGCSLLVSRRVCEEVGLMDKDYFLYAEEIEWCVRARQKGFRCIVVPESVVLHKEGASSGENYRPIFSYYDTRNMLQTIRKRFSFPQREFYLFTAISFKLWKSKRDIVKACIVKLGRSKVYKFDASTILGVIDFVLNRTGVKSRSAIMSFQNYKEVAPQREVGGRSVDETVPPAQW